ncbi:MAG: hypothetical protein K0U86_05510 [Planctomycetes bacterium]|nr:hypothetical protein [Planctomycetota bacterium]MCH9724346.1 hypothetical protein [Planctomycetota bacterium]MCH9777365.1 hypothetical protein [Planctomycetota bacterium]MCH9793481.1 hypothetical protein [Planctomycetota bacterium]MDF1745122.1 hypothetical protein [Gimesia sp.]
MSRRTQSGEVGYGSDSFLDIVANIVGILIILIVIAGVRMSQAPVTMVDDQSIKAPQPEIIDADLAAFPSPVETELPVPEAPALTLTEPDPKPFVPQKPKVIYQQPSAELLEELQQLEQELARIDQVKQSRETGAQELALRKRAINGELQTLNSKINLKSKLIDQQSQLLLSLVDSKQESQKELERVVSQSRLVSAPRDQVKELKHRLTPVSQLVTDKEWHFLLSENKVSYVPINELLADLKDQVIKRGKWLAKYREHHGSVGPIRGYTMNYVVERQVLSAIDQLRNGGNGGFRVGVTKWEIESDDEVPSETQAEALQVHSQFFQTLTDIGRGSTLTFWVYPDSFELYRSLQKHAHSLGYQVAGRPLPFGVPIAGSPAGTRSAGQ